MNTLFPIGELAKPAITNYLICLARKEKVEQIHFFLVQHIAESCSIPKSLRDVIRLLADIQKKWLESCLRSKKSTLMSYSLQLSTMRWYAYF